MIMMGQEAPATRKRRGAVKPEMVILDHTNTGWPMKLFHLKCRKIRGSVSPVAPMIVGPVFFSVFALDVAANGVAERR
jgi:hypothetical protein